MTNNNDLNLDDSLYEIVSGAGIVLLCIVFSKIIEYTNRIIIARFQGISDYGIINLGLSILLLLTAFSLFGIHLGVTRFTAYYKGLNDIENLEKTFSSGFKAVIVTSVPVAIAVFFSSRLIAVELFNKPELEPVISCFSIILPFSVFINFFSSALRGFKKAVYASVSQNLLPRFFVLIFLIIFLLFGLKLSGVILAYLVSPIFVTVIAVYFLHFKTYPFFKKSVILRGFQKKLIGYSWPLVVAFILIEIETKSATIILGYYRTADELGLYTAALPLAYIIPIFLNMIIFMMMPVASELYAKKDFKRLKMIYLVSNRWVFLSSSQVFLILFIFSEPILTLFFGSSFNSAAKILKILSLALLVYSILGCAGPLLLSIGKSKKYLFGDIIGVILNLSICIFLIPLMGMEGAAYAFLASMSVVGIIRLLFIMYYLRIHPFSINYLKFIIPAVAWSYVFFYFFIELLISTPLLLVPISIMLAAVIFFTFIILRGIKSDDLELLKLLEIKTGKRFVLLRKLIIMGMSKKQ